MRAENRFLCLLYQKNTGIKPFYILCKKLIIFLQLNHILKNNLRLSEREGIGMKLVDFRFGRDCESVEAVDTDRIISMSKEKGSTKLRIMLCGTKEDHIFDYFFLYRGM